MDKFFTYFVVTLLLLGVLVGVGYPTVYSFTHDTLTQMQLFKMFWPLELLAGICGIILGTMFSDN